MNANADGSVDKITVSDWLKNHGSSDALEDFSNLTNIKNVKGDETFTPECRRFYRLGFKR